MTEELKRHRISALATFGSTFLVTLAFAVNSNDFTFSQEALGAVLVSAMIAGARGLAKLVIEWNTGSIS